MNINTIMQESETFPFMKNNEADSSNGNSEKNIDMQSDEIFKAR